MSPEMERDVVMFPAFISRGGNVAVFGQPLRLAFTGNHYS